MTSPKASRPPSTSFSTLSADSRPVFPKSASETNLPNNTESDPPVRDDARSVFSNPGDDLNVEVAALSNKLISAINHQTKLDDSLVVTKHELDTARQRIVQLEAIAKEYADKLAEGVLVEKKDVEAQLRSMREKLEEEKMLREQAEKDKRNMEIEVETLTTALFDEANTMVAAARRDRDTVNRQNEHLKSQIKDTEALLATHQEQLAQLKGVMQQMEIEREEAEFSRPQTPTLLSRASRESIGLDFDALSIAPTLEDLSPLPATSLPNVVLPVLRYDIPAYHDFVEVLIAAKSARFSGNRSSGSSFSSIQMMGLSMPSPPQSSGLTSSFFGKRKGATESGSASVGHSPSSSAGDAQSIWQSLRESKFYKRVTLEDIEPTLRLENSPGLSWLARRSVQTAITEGSLVIDPIPMPASKGGNSSVGVMFPCALCGEARNDEEHARTHRMRINENQGAQRYPLCGYCVNRLRCVCDFMVFMRGIKEGIWKCDTPEETHHAWDESVKLRERMFWARIGGGMVPTIYARADRASRRSSGMHSSYRPETPSRTPGRSSIRTSLEIPKRRYTGESYNTNADQKPIQPSPLVIESSSDSLEIYDDAPSRTSPGVVDDKPTTPPVVTEEAIPAFETPKETNGTSDTDSILSTATASPSHTSEAISPTTATAPASTSIPQAPVASEPETERPSTPKHSIPGGW
ncbi:hypothetical protein EX30DRAFT_2142 [Ascodesmis nigricans]|uniref:GDP/GTP exchange factor Sec2 N-terminal domain-containing protein n=1 Tax=Ascodesmis nigricans TaxID=341454 RepID=A0A4S2N5I3_9PEZI|nr:hypothetical protein EX30DRAFT_2142 [Ascodesmis nigricans]